MQQRVGTAAALQRPAAIVRPAATTIQKRTLYRPEQLKGLYSKLTPEAQVASPAYGAAKYESGALKKMYPVESQAPAIKLVQELFHQQGPQFKPTALKSKAAYSLNASILGLVIGALETNTLKDPATRKYITEQWRAEHKSITEGDRMSEKKINDLLELIEKEYQQDKESARSILLGFLYAKANPDNNHDMLHYLTSLDKYIPVFAQEKTMEPYTMPEIPAMSKEAPSLLAKFKTMAQNFKDYVFTPQNYATLRSTLRTATNPEEAITHAKENFEETIGVILKSKQESNIYPPAVVQSGYGYKEQPYRPNCVETAMQDLFNIILYDPKTQSFDLSLLPANIKPRDSFIEFYALQNDISKINSPEIGQAFMNLVSDIPEVSYSSGNYELRGGSTPHNIVTLANYLLGTNVADVTELGKALSDDRRTITFAPSETKINMFINSNQDLLEWAADFCFRPGHGWLEAPKRNKVAQDFILKPELLQKEYSLSAQAQALFSLQQPNTIVANNKPMPSSFYYTTNVESAYGKIDAINHILFYDSDNKEATDYAFYLLKQLPSATQVLFVKDIMKNNLEEKNEKFKNIYKIVQPTADDEIATIIGAIINYAQFNKEATDYAFDLLKQLPPATQISFVKYIMKNNLEEKNEKFKNIYKIVQPTAEDPIAADNQRARITEAIIDYAKLNEEAADYAYSLYEQLSMFSRLRLLRKIFNSNIETTNPNFKDIYLTIKPEDSSQKMDIMRFVLQYYTYDQKAIDYIYPLFEEVAAHQKRILLPDILRLEINKTNDHFKNIYTILQPESETDRYYAIQAILKYDKNNKEAADYAYSLYRNLSAADKANLFGEIVESGIQNTSKDFQTVYQTLEPKDNDADSFHSIITKLFKYEKNNEDAINYAYSLYKKMPAGHQKHHLLEIFMESGIWKKNQQFSDLMTNYLTDAITAAIYTDNFNEETIKDLYNRVQDADKKKRFLTIMLDAVDSASDMEIIHNGKRVRIADEELVNITKELLNLGCDVNAPSKKRNTGNATPLIFAIAIGNPQLLELLIENGAHIQEPITSPMTEMTLGRVGSSGSSFIKLSTLTPLDYSVLRNDDTMAKVLLQHGANINAQTSSDPDNSFTPLILSCLWHKKDMAKFLLENGADPNISSTLSGKITTPLLTVMRDIDISRNSIITELIKHGADLNVTDADGNTALDIALKQKNEHRWDFNKSYETVEILEKAGAQTHNTTEAATKSRDESQL